eukprot:125157-Pelagomonas_calceolata.AAC.1
MDFRRSASIDVLATLRTMRLDGETCDPRQADSIPKDQQSVSFAGNDGYGVGHSWQALDGKSSKRNF